MKKHILEAFNAGVGMARGIKTGDLVQGLLKSAGGRPRIAEVLFSA